MTERAMRVAFIRQRYNPFGGAERFVERAAAALRAQGAAITVIARDWSSVEGAAMPDLVRCDPFHVGRLWRDRSFAATVCRLVARGHYDLVQSHERLDCCDVYRAGDGVHAQWLENRARVRSAAARALDALNPYHAYVVAAERRMFASAGLRAVICNSRMVRDEIVRRFGVPAEKLHVVYNGIDLERFHPRLRDEHRAAQRGLLGVRGDEPVYLLVGSGFERKGAAPLLDAFARLGPSGGRLVIVGKDRLQRAMERRAAAAGVARRVTFTGGKADVRPYYAAADCFVLPTLYDPFPNAAIEALACGLPVVTSTASGAAELIRAGENGFVCDALDIDAIAAHMRAAVALDRAAVLAAARASVTALGIDAMAAQLITLYRGLLGRSTHDP
jgi:UDP-glucose:(heptosyl)LPS alpha-1,3-glucosyltransferase